MFDMKEFERRLNILHKIENEIDSKISPILKDGSSYPWGLLRQPLIGDETMENEFQMFVRDCMTMWALGRYEFDPETGNYLRPEEGSDEALELERKHIMADSLIERANIYERIFDVSVDDIVKEVFLLKEGIS